MAGAATLKQGKDRRTKIMRYLRSYHKQHGSSPSQVEIAQAVGLASKSAAAHHLGILEKEGKIKLGAGKYRSIKVL